MSNYKSKTFRQILWDATRETNWSMCGQEWMRREDGSKIPVEEKRRTAHITYSGFSGTNGLRWREELEGQILKAVRDLPVLCKVKIEKVDILGDTVYSAVLTLL